MILKLNTAQTPKIKPKLTNVAFHHLPWLCSKEHLQFVLNNF